VRVGLFLAYWPWFSPEEQVELARLADRRGLDSIWVSEAWGQDAVSVLGHLSAVTERIALGSGLLQIPARTPAMTAMTAASLDVLSGGRFRLGLGVSGPQVSEGWHGVSFARPLRRTREYVEIVRAALAREGPLEYGGREFRLPLAGSELGKPLKLLAKPVQERIPIYLGAIGPKAVEQTALIADGWLPFMFSPEHADELLEPFAGRDVDISPGVMVCVDEDRDRARDLARPWLALYMGAMGAKDKNFYVQTAERFGHGESARRVQELFAAGDRAGAAAALSDGLIEASAIVCRPGELAQRLDDYERAGATTLLAMPFGDRPAIVEELAAGVLAR
jgi:F420-dependent oxidoreductase-like protein